MELPKDYWKCTKCGEIFPYKTEKCPIPKCHGDCISVEEESIEKAEVFTGGDMLKWVSGGLLIVLIGLILYAVVRNVSDVRLLGRRDVLTTDIEKLKKEKTTIDGELEPARATIAEAESIKVEKSRLSELERKLRERERAVEDRESKAKGLKELESNVRDAKGRLAQLKDEIKSQEEQRERFQEENARIKVQIEAGKIAQRELTRSNKDLSAAIVEGSRVWTNLSAKVIATEAEVKNVTELRAVAESWRRLAEQGEQEFRNATNAISALTIQYSRVTKARGDVNAELKKLKDQASVVVSSLNQCGGEIKGMIKQLERTDKQIAVDGESVKRGIRSAAEGVDGALKGFSDVLEAQKEKAGRVEEAVSEFEKRLFELRKYVESGISRITNDWPRISVETKEREVTK